MKLGFEIRKIISIKLIVITAIITLIGAISVLLLNDYSLGPNACLTCEEIIANNQKGIEETQQNADLDAETKSIFIEMYQEKIEQAQYQQKEGLNPATTVENYLNDTFAFGLNFLLPFVAIIIGTKVLGVEYKNKTINPLLLRPISRASLAFSKVIGAIVSLAIMQILITAILMVVGVICFGHNGFAGYDIYVVGDSMKHVSLSSYLVITFALMFLMNLVLMLFVAALSAVIRSSAGLMAIGLVILYSGGFLMRFVEKSIAKYVLLNTCLDIYSTAAFSYPTYGASLTPSLIALLIWGLSLVVAFVLLMHTHLITQEKSR